MNLETIAIHAGIAPDAETGAITPPIHLSTTFEREPDLSFRGGHIYPGPQPGTDMKHFSHEGAPIPAAYGPYSHSIVAGDFVFLAGQTARDAVSGKVIDADIATQTTRTLEIVRDILHEHSLTLRDVVRATVYLAHMEDFDAMNDVYAATFEAPYPVRTTVEVVMPYGALVGMEVTAFRGRSSGS